MGELMLEMSSIPCIIQVGPVLSQGSYSWKRKAKEGEADPWQQEKELAWRFWF